MPIIFFLCLAIFIIGVVVCINHNIPVGAVIILIAIALAIVGNQIVI